MPWITVGQDTHERRVWRPKDPRNLLGDARREFVEEQKRRLGPSAVPDASFAKTGDWNQYLGKVNSLAQSAQRKTPEKTTKNSGKAESTEESINLDEWLVQPLPPLEDIEGVMQLFDGWRQRFQQMQESQDDSGQQLLGTGLLSFSTNPMPMNALARYSTMRRGGPSLLDV